MFAIRSFISIIDDHSLTPCSPVVVYRFTYHAQPVVVDNSRDYRRFGAGHQQRLEKSNRTCWGLPRQSPCGIIQTHTGRASAWCRSPVGPKPCGASPLFHCLTRRLEKPQIDTRAFGASIPQKQTGLTGGISRKPNHLQCKAHSIKLATKAFGDEITTLHSVAIWTERSTPPPSAINLDVSQVPD